MEEYNYLVKKYEKRISTPFYFNDKDEMLRFAFNEVSKNSFCFLDIYAFNDFTALGGKKFWRYFCTIGNVECGKYSGMTKNKSLRAESIDIRKEEEK